MHFIFQETARISESLSKHGFKSIPKDDHWYHLPHPEGCGHLICGEAAHIRVERLALAAGNAAQLTNRVDLSTLREPLKRLLVHRFICEKRPVTRQQIDRVLASVGREAQKKCSNRNHFVPCHLMWIDDPTEFHLGPVTFHGSKNFRKRIAKETNTFVAEAEEERRNQYATLLGEAFEYYDSFKWIAEICVRGCDARVSKDIALKAVTSALDCIQLLFGPAYTGKMCVRGPRLDIDKRAELHVGGSGKLSVSISMGGPGEVGFEEGWAAILDRGSYKQCAELFGIALEAATDPDVERPLSRRFLEAASWYGQAVRETDPAAKVVKFITALERMVMTAEKDDITSIVAERTAALCYERAKPAKFNEWRSEVSKVYDLRSRLVHGALSPHDESVSQGVHLAAAVSRSGLLNAIASFGREGLMDDKASTRRLAKHYSKIVERTRELISGNSN